MPASAHEQVAGAGTPKQRLIITKMVLENFKSYGGIQEIGPFHKSFTSIIGPNGRYVFLWLFIDFEREPHSITCFLFIFFSIVMSS